MGKPDLKKDLVVEMSSLEVLGEFSDIEC